MFFFYQENRNHFDYIHIYIYVCSDISFKKKKIEKDINNAFLKILYENYEYMISAYSFQTIRKKYDELKIC